MTRKLYDLDSYITSCKATVLSCEPAKKNGIDGFAVLLDQTCFFPEGGGQPSDMGTLQSGDNCAQVLYAYEQDEDVFHLCDAPLSVGSVVDAALDFDRRFAHMQVHSGEHILSGIILKKFGLHNVGFHMGHELNTIDLDGEITPAQAADLEKDVNAVICENRPVFVSYPNAEQLTEIPLRKKPEVEHLRVVEIQNCDWCGCCGTHVAHTGEIGLLKILDVQRYKGGTRMSFLCGSDAVADCAEKCQTLKQICVSLSCKPQEAYSNVEKLKVELSEKKQALAAKNRQLFSLLAKDLCQNAEAFGEDKLVFVFDNVLSADDLKSFAAQLSQYENIIGALFSEQNGVISYALCCSKDAHTDLRALNQHLVKTLNGKGGGSKELCCGRLQLQEPQNEKAIHQAVLSFLN